MYASPPRPSDLGEADGLVEEAARLLGRAGRGNRTHDRAFFHRLREHGELRAAEDLGHVGRFDRIAQVRLVAPVHHHRIVVGDARERRRRDRPVGELAEDAGQHRLDGRKHVVLRHERQLDVELIELAGRAIRPRVLVAKTGRDLEVAIEAGDHQQLLELLRRLRQRVELARDGCGWARGSRARLPASSTSGSASGTRGTPARASAAGCSRSPSSAGRCSRESSRGADRETGSAGAAPRESPACRRPERAAARPSRAPRGCPRRLQPGRWAAPG